MSKVYSFRLDDNNPREAQARGVIDAWVSKGYSLRRIIVDALSSFHNNEPKKMILKKYLKSSNIYLGQRAKVANRAKMYKKHCPKHLSGRYQSQ